MEAQRVLSREELCDNNELVCVCEQHLGSHGHWAQRVVELRNTCPSLGDGWDVSKEK